MKTNNEPTAERNRVIEEVMEMIEKAPAMTLTNPVNNHPKNAYKLVDRAELRAKLKTMKGK